MVQHEVLDAMHEKHALGVVIQHRVQREVQQHQTSPEQRLARTGHAVNALSTDEQPGADRKERHQGGRQFPGLQPFEDHFRPYTIRPQTGAAGRL